MPEHKYRTLFTNEEWEYFLRLGSSKHDPEEKKLFYAGIMERKVADPKFSVFDAFPIEDGNSICAEIICLLKKSNEKHMQKQREIVEPEKSGELKELGELFSKLIQEGRHLNSDREKSA